MKGMKGRLVLLTAAALLLGGQVAPVAAQGLVGQCSDCHTMHNSAQGKAVAQKWDTATRTLKTGQSANPNLLKMDCIACHAAGGSEAIRAMPGGSRIPQVYHSAATDLAAGNFRHITVGGNRKGHNVVDVVPQDSELLVPPGFRHASAEAGAGRFDVTKFTCAGAMGCHGYRGQVLDTIVDSGPPCNPEFELCDDSSAGGTTYVYRTGLQALSGYDGLGTTAIPVELKRGAHHANYDGLKNNGVTSSSDFYANPLANSYRFIRSLHGYGNQLDRWQNKNADSHNEYAGGYDHTPVAEANRTIDFGTTDSCTRCHIGGINATTSRLTTPSSTITGFCITCHGSFHSSGATQGSSGAFLRHPSDYALPDRGEYLNYTNFDVTAPVARRASYFVEGMGPSAQVTAGEDVVMCLSCHVAHASPYDGMLRFDYAAQTSAMRAGSFASIAEAQAAGGCLACHTTKGVAKGAP
jgi:hypothetical protein